MAYTKVSRGYFTLLELLVRTATALLPSSASRSRWCDPPHRLLTVLCSLSPRLQVRNHAAMIVELGTPVLKHICLSLQVVMPLPLPLSPLTPLSNSLPPPTAHPTSHLHLAPRRRGSRATRSRSRRSAPPRSSTSPPCTPRHAASGEHPTSDRADPNPTPEPHQTQPPSRSRLSRLSRRTWWQPLSHPHRGARGAREGAARRAPRRRAAALLGAARGELTRHRQTDHLAPPPSPPSRTSRGAPRELSMTH